MAINSENENPLVVDLSSRTISIPDELRYIGVETDNNAEKVWFNVPRYFDEPDVQGSGDLLAKDAQVQFLNAGGSFGVYNITEKNDNEDGTISLAWLIDKDVTMVAGEVKFQLVFTLFENGSNVYKLSTTPATLIVRPGIDSSDRPIPQDSNTYEQLIEFIYSQSMSEDDRSRLDNFNNLSDEVAELHNTVVPDVYVDLTKYGLEETDTENVYKAEYNPEYVDVHGNTVYRICDDEMDKEIKISIVSGVGYTFNINGEDVELRPGDTWTGKITYFVFLRVVQIGGVLFSVSILGADGLMSKEDKTKLDGIESGATRNANISDTDTEGVEQIIDDTFLSNDTVAFGTNNPRATTAYPALVNGIPAGANGDHSAAFNGRTASNGQSSAAFGSSVATAKYSFATGSRTAAIGDSTFTTGYQTAATANFASAEGAETLASNNASHAEGRQTTASGTTSHAEGVQTSAEGVASHSEGDNTHARGDKSHTEGTQTITTGDYSHAEGNNTRAQQTAAHSEGLDSISRGVASHSEGAHTEASGYASHSEGSYAKATNHSAHAEGKATQANAEGSHTEGNYSVVLDEIRASATPTPNAGGTSDIIPSDEEDETQSNDFNMEEHYGYAGHGEGSHTVTYGYASHAEGMYTKAYGHYSHAEGSSTIAGELENQSGVYKTKSSGSHAEGSETKATGNYSHSEGVSTTASGSGSHAEGGNNTASNTYSHAEGWKTRASGTYSHAEGVGNKAIGVGAHAEGSYTEATGDYSHASGIGTRATFMGQTVVGRFNVPEDNTTFIVGAGADNNRFNAITVYTNGDVRVGKQSTNNLSIATFGYVQTLLDRIVALEARIAALEEVDEAEGTLDV